MMWQLYLYMTTNCHCQSYGFDYPTKMGRDPRKWCPSHRFDNKECELLGSCINNLIYSYWSNLYIIKDRDVETKKHQFEMALISVHVIWSVFVIDQYVAILRVFFPMETSISMQIGTTLLCRALLITGIMYILPFHGNVWYFTLMPPIKVMRQGNLLSLSASLC